MRRGEESSIGSFRQCWCQEISYDTYRQEDVDERSRELRREDVEESIRRNVQAAIDVNDSVKRSVSV